MMRLLRLALYWLIDSAACWRPTKPSRTALVVRLDGIGDFVVWLQSGAADVVAELRRDHNRVVIAASAAFAPLAAATELFDETIAIVPKAFMHSPSYRWRKLLEVRAVNARTVLQPRAGRVFLMEDELVRISGATERIGMRGVPLNTSRRLMRWSDRFYSRLIDGGPDISEHESLRNERFADAFCRHRLPPFGPGSLIAAHPVEVEGPFFVIAPGAGVAGRRWPVDKFVEVGRRLHAETGWRCIVAGSAEDEPASTAIVGALVGSADSFCGKLGLPQSASLLSQAELLVTNDSGLLHIGVWCGTRVVALMGGGQFGWFAPYPPSRPHADRLHVVNHQMPCYGCDFHCKFDVRVSDPYPCVARIDIQQVIEASNASIRSAG